MLCKLKDMACVQVVLWCVPPSSCPELMVLLPGETVQMAWTGLVLLSDMLAAASMASSASHHVYTDGWEHVVTPCCISASHAAHHLLATHASSPYHHCPAPAPT